MKGIRTTRSLSWIGFVPAMLFAFGKFAGFITLSWWWIIISIVMVYPKKTKEDVITDDEVLVKKDSLANWQCKEDGCDGVLDSEKIVFLTSAEGTLFLAPTCNKCGRLHDLAGEGVSTRDGRRAFNVDGKSELRPATT